MITANTTKNSSTTLETLNASSFYIWEGYQKLNANKIPRSDRFRLDHCERSKGTINEGISLYPSQDCQGLIVETDCCIVTILSD